MALEENEGRKIYLNIKEGRIHYKDPKTGEKKDTGTVSGTITHGVVNQKEWEGKKYEELALTIVDGTDKYLLQVNLNSGYFRAFCNQMKSGMSHRQIMSIWNWLLAVQQSRLEKGAKIYKLK